MGKEKQHLKEQPFKIQTERSALFAMCCFSFEGIHCQVIRTSKSLLQYILAASIPEKSNSRTD